MPTRTAGAPLKLAAALWLTLVGLPAAAEPSTNAPTPASIPAPVPASAPAPVPAPADDRARSQVGHTRERNALDTRLGAARAQPGAAVAQEATCDRPCLQALMDAYLKAVVAHDPKLLPLADHARFTEMGQELSLGDGFWSTASGVGGFQLYFPDPVSQQIGFIGTMREFDHVVMMALRLKVQNRRISEIESLFYRKGTGPAWSDAGIDAANSRGADDEIWLAPIAAAQRASREQLTATAQAWLEGLARNDGKGSWPVSDDCVRLENGAQVTDNPQVLIGGRGFNLAALGCRQQLQSGYYALITREHHRRIVAVDPEHGLVLAWANLDQAGTRALRLADGRVLATPALAQPTGTEAVFALRIEQGLIRRIAMVSARVPYHMSPGWEDDVVLPGYPK